MRDVVWSEDALADMSSIATYIANDNPQAALRVLDRIDATASNLARTPSGRRGRVEGTYEKSVTGLPYIIAYAIQRQADGGERIVILHVIHTSRNWPRDGWPQ